MKNLPSLTTFKGTGYNFTNIGKVILENIPSLTSERIQLRNAFESTKEFCCSNADSLEYYITKNSRVKPSEHLLSLHPSVLWRSETYQMKQISSSVESIVIQGNIGCEEKTFNISYLPSLITIEIGCSSFRNCHKVAFENLTQLQSITIGSDSFMLHRYTVDSNELIMRNLPSLTTFKGEGGNFLWISKVILKNIPSLTQDGICMGERSMFFGISPFSFEKVKELVCSNADSLDRFIRERSKLLKKVHIPQESDSSDNHFNVDSFYQFRQQESTSPGKKGLRIRIKRDEKGKPKRMVPR